MGHTPTKETYLVILLVPPFDFPVPYYQKHLIKKCIAKHNRLKKIE